MTRRDILSLLAALPLVGRLFREPEPFVTVHSIYFKDGGHVDFVDYGDGYDMSKPLHCDAHATMPFVLLAPMDVPPRALSDTYVFDEAMQENDDDAG